jgi:diguanylate cyclase
LDHHFNELISKFHNLNARKEHLASLNQAVSKAMWLLDDISQSIINQDNGRDPLTQLFNRRYLETVLHHETDCSMQNGLIFGLIMLDIDHFKKVNDTHGHSVGDKVLSQVAGVVSREMRAGDFIFRYGGEEFLIILTDTNLSILKRTAEKIRAAVEMTSFTIEKKSHLNITISLGAALHDGHPDFLRTINAADAALFEAKKNGRNCVVIAS